MSASPLTAATFSPTASRIGGASAAPRGAANPALTSPVVIQRAARPGVTPPQVALQWLLQLAPNVLLIPGPAPPVTCWTTLPSSTGVRRRGPCASWQASAHDPGDETPTAATAETPKSGVEITAALCASTIDRGKRGRRGTG